MDTETKRAIIMDNYSHPFHKERKSEGYIKVNHHATSCIDDIDLYILIEDGIIKDLYFDGEACAISTASTSIMIKNLIGSSLEEAKEHIINFNKMLNEEEYIDCDFNEANVFDETYKQGNRRTCVTLPYTALLKVIDAYEKK